MSEPLVDGHGNFGSVDGDGAAAMRYTEARLSKLAEEMLRDIEKDTVDMQLNFDDSLREPVVLPCRFPNLLVNGASGIAVGMATNMPTHNLGEVIDGCVAYVKNAVARVENPEVEPITVAELMEHIKAPDFPTGGTIYGYQGVRDAYETGRGRIIIRSKAEIETEDNGRERIVIGELPYGVVKSDLVKNIADLVNDKKIEGISGISDQSKRDVRIIIEIKRDANAQVVLNKLYKYTALQSSFSVNSIALVKGRPQLLNLHDMVANFIEHRMEVVVRRTKFELKKAEERAHILEGLIIAVQNIDEVIAIIKKSDSTSDARAKLMQRFEISETQAQAILDLRLARLTKLEIFKLEEELKELKKLIKKLTAISKNGDLQLQVVKEEITEIKNAYPSPRRSKLVFTREEADETVATAPVKKSGMPCTLAYTADQRFKVLTGKQTDGLEKVLEGKYKPQLVALHTLRTTTDKTVFAFTNYGNCHKLDISDPSLDCKLSDDGVALRDLSKDAEVDEKVVALFEVGEHLPYGNLLFFTQKGMIKKTEWGEYEQRKSCFQAVKLNDGDELINVEAEREEDETIIIVTKGGICLNALKDDIPVQGRIATGVRGIMLRDEDAVVLMKQINGEGEIVIATDEGKFKRVIASQIDISKRYKKGSIIVGLREGASVLSASYVTTPYMLAVVEKNNTVSELSSEDVFISVQSARAKRVLRYAEDSVKEVFPLPYKKGE